MITPTVEEIVAKIMRDQDEHRINLASFQLKWFDEHRKSAEQVRAWVMDLGIYK